MNETFCSGVVKNQTDLVVDGNMTGNLQDMIGVGGTASTCCDEILTLGACECFLEWCQCSGRVLIFCMRDAIGKEFMSRV